MKQAVILAAGEGQRLRPFTVTKPKVMLAIAGKPILQYVIEALVQNGIRRIVIVVGYQKEQVFDYLGSGEQLGAEISYITQQRQLGTAHALKQVKSLTEDEFLVLPGDNLIEAATIAHFVTAKPWAMLIKRVEDPFRSELVTVDQGMVKEATRPERRTSGSNREPGTHSVNTSIYAFSSEIFNLIGHELDIPDVLNRMLAQGVAITALETDGPWLDAAYPWDILRLNSAVLRQTQPTLGGTIEAGVQVSGPVSVGKNTVIRSNSYIMGPVVIGDGCDIGPNVCILPATSLGNNVAISPFSEVKNSVIGSDVAIGPGSIVQDSVIDKGCLIRGQFSALSDSTEVKINEEYYPVTVGAMLGEGCHLASGVVAQAGVILGNYSQVKALKLISGRLPDHSLVV